MKPRRPEEGSQRLTSNHRSIGGEVPPLRVMLENGMGNGGRRWRLSAGFLLQAAVLATILLLPLLFTESLDSTPRAPQIILVMPPREGVPEGEMTGTGRGGGGTTSEVRRHPNLSALSSDLLLPSPWSEAAVELDLPGIGPGEGPGDARLGVRGGAGEGPGIGIPVGQAPQPPEPIRVGGRVRAPRLLRMVKPEYPFVARQARIEGDVVLEAVLGTDGTVQAVKVVQGHPALREAAAEGVKQWLYEPTYLNERPVPVILEIVVRFRLRD